MGELGTAEKGAVPNTGLGGDLTLVWQGAQSLVVEQNEVDHR
jgi:hypothetical protein